MKHVLFTLYECDPELLDDEDYIRETLFEATNYMGATFLKTQSHKFSPQGVTAVTLLSESHISIHTWPGTVLQFVMFLHVVISTLKRVLFTWVEN